MIALNTRNTKITKVIQRIKYLGCLSCLYLIPKQTEATAINKFSAIIPEKCSLIKLYMPNNSNHITLSTSKKNKSTQILPHLFPNFHSYPKIPHQTSSSRGDKLNIIFLNFYTKFFLIFLPIFAGGTDYVHQLCAREHTTHNFKNIKSHEPPY